MSGRFLVRTGDGTFAEFPLRARLTIGSGAPSDVVLDGAGILPLHATADVRDQDCWIESVGEARIAINGQPAARRSLRHLDVVTLGDHVHVIFSTSPVTLAAPRNEMPAPESLPAAAGRTQMFSIADATAPMMAPPTSTKTVMGVPIQKFVPPEPQPASPKTTFGVPVARFAPPAPPPDSTGDLPAAAPPRAPEVPLAARFEAVGPSDPTSTQVHRASADSPMTSVQLGGPAGVFAAPLGKSVIGRGSDATLRIDRPELSRVHAVLVATPARVTIEDLGSRNGTSVNGVRVSGEHALADGDLLSFGTLDLRVEFVRLGGGG